MEPGTPSQPIPLLMGWDIQIEFQGIDVGMDIITYLSELIIINICQITVKISCCKSIKRRKNKERKEKHSHSHHSQPKPAGESGVRRRIK